MTTYKIEDRSKGYLIGLIILLTMVSMVGSFISDTYLPALPAIATHFAVDSGKVQNTLSFYLLGFAVSQLLYGRCADAYGRRNTLLAGLVTSLIGSLGCLFAPSIEALILFRLIQGLGAGAGVVIARAVARDLFSGARLAQIISYMTLFFVIAPALAPVLGSYIQHWLGWRMIFAFIILYILALTIWSVAILPETTVPTYCMNLKKWLRDYVTLLTNYNFIRHCYCSTIALAGFFAYYAVSPFLFEKIYGLSVVAYGWLAVVIGAFSAVSRYLNGVLVVRYGITQVIFWGLIMLLIGAFMMLGGFFLKIANVQAVFIPMVIFVVGAGFVFANSFAGAMKDFASMAGTASSWYGFLQILGTFVTTWLITKFAVHNQFVLAITLSFLAISGLLIYAAESIIEFVTNQFVKFKHAYF